MIFDLIVGHERSLAALQRAAAEDRLPPSLLFHGPDGVGKRRVAFALAGALNCTESPGRGCGECPACCRILKGYEETKLRGADARRAPGHHADVLYYPPRRRQIALEQIQDLCREAGFRPFEGRRRFFLIDPADRMSREAANALLKTLEEPPSSACLILLTASPGALPATIRSRCQTHRFAPLGPQELTDLLVSRDHAPATAARLARLADGSVGRALGIDLAAHDLLRDRLLRLLEAGLSADGRLAALGLAASEAERFDELARSLGSLLRDLALLAAAADPGALMHAALAARLAPPAPRSGPPAPRALDRIEEATRRVRGNVNARLAGEALLMDLLT